MDQRLKNLAQARVLVVGDLILDRYWHGASRRISPEAPVPVVLIEEIVEGVGGAANVAANIAALGGKVELIGVVGADIEGQTLERLCLSAGITPEFLRVSGRATTVKLRVVSQRQQLLRIDFEQEAAADLVSEIIDSVERRVARCDLVVVSDYAKGAVTRVPEIIQCAKRADRPVIVDPKGSDFSRYNGAALITPNIKEFEAVAGVCVSEDEIVSKAARLLAEHDFGAVLVTRGASGMSLVQKDGNTVHVSAQAHEVFDVTGAGDTVCGVIAAALAAGSDLPTAVELANTAASLVVGKFGAATVSIEEIDGALVDRAGIRRGVVSEPELHEECGKARRRGERIVMTNGCFDILHAGHARYLAEAKMLGNRLLVAVNDDASVRDLKGSERPLNTLAARMQVLAALDAVDWVVSFSGETPVELIGEVMPDVLVKGGDYEIGAVAGAAEVQAGGGEVVILKYHEGYSSSRLFEQLSARGKTSS